MTTISYPIYLNSVSDFEQYIKDECSDLTVLSVVYNSIGNKKILSTIDIRIEEVLSESEVNNLISVCNSYVYPYIPIINGFTQNSSTDYRYLSLINGKFTSFTTSFSDVPFSITERCDDSYSCDSGVITFLTAGVYLIHYKLSIMQTDYYYIGSVSSNNSVKNSVKNNNDESQAVFKVIVDNGSGFTDLPASTYYLNITSNIDSDANNGILCFIYTAAVNDKLKLQVKNESNDNDINLDFDNICNIINMSHSNSLSKVISLYDTSLKTLNSSYSDISFNSQRIIDTDNYTHSGANITFLSDAVYYINLSINTRNYGNDKHNQATFKLQLNSGGGFNDIPGTFAYTYNIYDDNIKGGNIANIIFISEFNNGNIIKLQGKDSENDNIKIQTINFNIVKFQDVIQKFNSFNGYNSDIISINNIYKDIPINTERIKNSSYIHDIDSSIIKINKRGTFFIIYNINSYSTDSTKSQNKTRIMIKRNDENNYEEIITSIGTKYTSKSSEGSYTTNSCFLMIFLNKYDELKLQILSTDNNNKYITSNGCNFTIFCLENPIETKNNNVIKFGNYFQIYKSSSIVCSSTKFIPIIYLNTSNIPSGTYRIGYSFGFNIDDNYDICNLKILINYKTYNLSDIINPNKIFNTNDFNYITSSFIYVDLQSGIYIIQLVIKNESDDEFTIKEPQIEFWQVN